MTRKPTQWPPRAATVHGVLAAASTIVDYNGWSGREGRTLYGWATQGPEHASTDVVGAIQWAATGNPDLSNEIARAAVKAFEEFAGDGADMWNDEVGRTAREVVDELAACAEHECEYAEQIAAENRAARAARRRLMAVA